MKFFKQSHKFDKEFSDFDRSVKKRMKEMRKDSQKIDITNKKVEDVVTKKFNQLYSK